MKRDIVRYIVVVLWLLGMQSLAARQYVNLNQDNPAEDSLVQAILSSSDAIVSMPCTYASVDQFGQPVTLSGKIYFPRDDRAKNFVLQPHYTILSNAETPSECDMPEAVLQKKGYALLMPDYLGYGITRDVKHPYLHWRLAAQNTLDLYFAAAAFLDKLNRTPANDSLILVGYSQGAQSAIATLRLLETEYPQVPVKHCYASSGPYDAARTYDVCMARDNAGLSFTIPLLVMGTSWSYDLNLDSTYFLLPKTIKRADKYVFTKEHTATEVVLFSKMGCSSKVSRYMTPEGMDKSLPKTAVLYDGLLRSSIVHVSDTDTILGDWTPRAPIFLMHSRQDKSVPFENSLSLQLMLETKGVQNVEYDFGNYGGHVSSLMRFLDILSKRL